MPPPERRLWKMVFDNFIKSLKSKTKEEAIGVDNQGNKYFEIPADPQGGRRLPRRWFVPLDEETGVPTPEWSQWLRGRRDTPPTDEEIAYNNHIANMKKINAEKISQKFELPESNDNSCTDKECTQNAKGFPDMSNKFERQPGQFSR